MLIFPLNVFSKTNVITCFGDSLTAGYGLEIKESYPSLLQEKLKKEGFNYNIINSGISGDTTAGGLSRVDWVLKTNPEIVILELGANDAMRGVPIEETKKNLSKIIEKIKAKNVKILFCGMKAPRNLGKTYIKSFDEMYPELSKKYSLKLLPFFLEGVALKKELNISDGVHPNKKGYDIIVNNNVFPYLKSFLK